MKYGVTIPITGIAYAEVEAESEKEAIEKALQEDLEILEWESHKQVCQGNVFHGHTNEASAEEIE